MSTLPQGDTSKSVRVFIDTWESVSHEAVDRRVSIAALLGIAWRRFMQMPEEHRESVVREHTRTGAQTESAA